MGGVVSSLFGGSKQSSTSSGYNQAYNYLNGALAPTVTAGTGAIGNLSGMLNGTDNGAGYQNFLNSTGYQQQLKEGLQGVTNNAAMKGTLQSGATMKALNNYAQNTAATSYQNYLGDLSNVGSLGLQAAGVIGGAGQVSNSSSKGGSNGGIIPGLFG